MKGYVSKIQRFSLDDGPGIRTTVFLRGCNLNCKWCHNPECIPNEQTLLYYAASCTSCGACAAICPEYAHEFFGGEHTIDREACIACGKCTEVCAANALEMNAREWDAEELVERAARDEAFFKKSGGGITISGGDPMMQVEFLEKLLILARERGIHTAVDTAGLQAFSRYEKILPLADMFLYDIKMFTPELHKQAVGTDNALILENLKKLAAAGARIWVRVPVIPEYHTETELRLIAEYLKPLDIERIELLPYHRYGIGKYASLGLQYDITCEEPSQEFMEKAALLFEGAKAEVRVG